MEKLATFRTYKECDNPFNINSNTRYCFVKGLRYPEQNLGQNPYTELFRTVVNGKFTCRAG